MLVNSHLLMYDAQRDAFVSEPYGVVHVTGCSVMLRNVAKEKHVVMLESPSFDFTLNLWTTTMSMAER
jgi:hypothetical protein